MAITVPIEGMGKVVGTFGVSQGGADSVRASLSDPWPGPSDPMLESRDSGQLESLSWLDDQAQDSGHFMA